MIIFLLRFVFSPRTVQFAFLFWGVGFLVPSPGNSAQEYSTLHINENRSQYAIGSALYFLEDPEGTVTFEDLQGNSTSIFKPSKEVVPNFGFTSSVYWFRFTLQSNIPSREAYFLKIAYPLLDKIDLYIPQEMGGYRLQSVGDRYPFEMRTFQHPDYIFELKLPPQSPQTYFMRVATSSAMNVPLSLLTADSLVKQLTTENLILGGFLGILFAMMVHNCFVFITTRDPAYFYYVLFVFCNILFQFTLRGFTFQFVWPNQVWWANNCLPVIIFACYLTAAQFTRFAVNSKETTPKMDLLLQRVSWLVMAGLLSSFFLDYAISIKVATAFILTVPLFIFMAVKSLLLGYRPALYYCIAWGGSLFGYFVFSLKSFGVLPHTFFTHYGIQVGAAWEVILFSIGLADRYHFLKKEKELMQIQSAEVLEKANRQLETSNSQLDKANKELHSTVIKLSDEIGKREEMQRILSESEKTARVLIDTPFNFAALLEVDGTIIDMNKTLADFLNEEPKKLIGKNCFSIADNGVIKKRSDYLSQTVTSGKLVRFEDSWGGRSFDNIFSPVLDEKGNTLRVCLMSRDITERIEAEKKRQEMEVKAISQAKLASLGQIATGIAHEINQPLSYINIIFESALRDIEQDSFDIAELQEDARESLRQVKRITTIISHLRTFGRVEGTDHEKTDIVEVYANAMILMRERLSLNNITISVELADDLPLVSGNTIKLEQIFINLLQNSMDAMEEKEADKNIWIRGRATKETVILEFEDNGTGIKDLGDTVFQPFFTTKSPGKGTGLGLAIVYGIVKEHQGTISCLNSSSGGALFEISLPIDNEN